MEMRGLRERPKRFPHKSSSLQGPWGEVRRETVQVPLLVRTPGTRVVSQIHSSPQICAPISIPIESKPLFQDAQGTWKELWVPWGGQRAAWSWKRSWHLRVWTGH